MMAAGDHRMADEIYRHRVEPTVSADKDAVELGFRLR